MRGIIRAVCLALAVALVHAPVQAERYPSRPVRIVVPYGPGGIADVTMRLIAQSLSTHFDQRFFIEDRPGAGGIVGMRTVEEAPADGYTLAMIGGGLTIAKALFRHLPYDIEADFVPISMTASYGLVIVSKTGSSYKTIHDVIVSAKGHPGTLNLGTINAGSAQNLSAELFRIMADIDVSIIPYKTTPDLMNAVLRGDVDLAFEYFVGLQSAIASGQMTVVATTGSERASNLPTIPTVIEGGLAEYEVTSWNGLAVRGGTPVDIVAQLNRGVLEALKSPEIQQFASGAGMDAQGTSPDDLRERIKRDIAKWSKVVDKAGVERK